MEAASHCVNEREKWRALAHMQLNEFHTAIFALPCLLAVRPPVLWCYHLDRGGMPFHDAVGMNCKKGATTENQGADVKYMG